MQSIFSSTLFIYFILSLIQKLILTNLRIFFSHLLLHIFSYSLIVKCAKIIFQIVKQRVKELFNN